MKGRENDDWRVKSDRNMAWDRYLASGYLLSLSMLNARHK